MNREEDGKLTVCVFFVEIETSVFQQSAIMIGIRIMIREGVYPCFFSHVYAIFFHSDVLRRQKHVFHLYSMNTFPPCYSLIEISIQRSLRHIYFSQSHAPRSSSLQSC